MNLNTLKPAEGSVKNIKRIGRGTGSGRGGTSTRGHKGAGSRSGNKKKRGFEGGQMPLQRRIPKFGFKNINRVEFNGVNIDVLQKMCELHNVTIVNPQFLVEHGLSSKSDKVKVLGRGEMTIKLEVSAHAFSESAQKAIEAAGGSIVII